MRRRGTALASVMTIVLNVAWYGLAALLVVTIIAVVWGSQVAVQFEPDGSPNIDTGPNVHMAIPVSFTVDTSVHRIIAPSLGITEAEIRDSRGALRFPPPRNGVFLVLNLFLVGASLGLALWVLGQLRALFRTLRDGHPFAPANASRVRRVAWVVILGAIARTSIIFWQNFYVARYFSSDGLTFTARPEFSVMAIVNGLAILVIAEVFRAGTRLDEDQSLTI